MLKGRIMEVIVGIKLFGEGSELGRYVFDYFEAL